MLPLTGRCVNFGYEALAPGEALGLLWDAVTLLAGRTELTSTRWRSECERVLSLRMGGAQAYAFPSARASLLGTLQAMQVGGGDEVLVAGFTCVAVPAAIVFSGARPVYVDIHPRTFNINVAELEARITRRSKAIIVQHTFGNPVDMHEVLRIARAHGLYVIEDCALALGSDYDGRPVGTFGDAGFVSFEISKTLSAGWGGIAWTSNPVVAARLSTVQARCKFRPRGTAAWLLFQVALSYALYHPNGFLAGRYLSEWLYRTGVFRASAQRQEARGCMPVDYFDQLSDGHWRVIAAQLRRLEHIVAQSRRVAASYREVLDAAGHSTYPHVLPTAVPAWCRFPFLVAEPLRMRRYFRTRLISIGRWFSAVVSGATDSTIFGYTPGMCPMGELASRHAVNLPVSIRLTSRDEAWIRETLRSYLDRHPEEREFARCVCDVQPGMALHFLTQ